MRILVIGSDSTIGAGLTAALLARGHSVVGTTRNSKNIKKPNVIFFDLASDDQPALPDTEAAVICAAMTRFEECHNQPDLAYRVNVEAPFAIANQLVPVEPTFCFFLPARYLTVMNRCARPTASRLHAASMAD